jgi:hypothetical protein
LIKLWTTIAMDAAQLGLECQSWFVPRLYVGVCLAVAGLVLADLLGLL